MKFDSMPEATPQGIGSAMAAGRESGWVIDGFLLS
jgi:hypothetical protein